MKTDTQNLMKHFSSVLRTRANSKEATEPSISKSISRFLSRKELIEIIKEKFSGSIPKEHNLVELENEQLLDIIGDDMYIIAYCTQKWCGESPLIGSKKTEKKEPTKPNSNGKGTSQKK
ncbi:hypothetical protein [Pseudotenacibaculum haliotis]|uniref:Uncharacterized protein n=1 Tax=Pseudotenacibaculum haliotis TaxID=1862138 RepID=A0ABW5LM47_9FLAO